MKDFKIALQKGEAGELIIKEYLESRGWVVYCPLTKDKAHYFDILASLNKEKVIAIDVKTKARLNNWPAQGINIKSYREYKKFAETTNVPFYLVFVDDKTGDVHSQELNKLTNEFYPGKSGQIVAWPLDCMLFLFNIGEDKIKELSKYDQRNYDFIPNANSAKSELLTPQKTAI